MNYNGFLKRYQKKYIGGVNALIYFVQIKYPYIFDEIWDWENILEHA